MQKDFGGMSDHELLVELARQGQRREKTEIIKICVLAALLLALVVLALVYVPRLVEPIRQLNEKMEIVDQTAIEAKRILEGFDDKAVEQFKQTIESMNETSQQTRAFMEKLKNSGIDKLQTTLESFNETLESILRFFK